MVGVAVGDGRLQLDVDAVLREQKLVVLFEPQPAQTVLLEDCRVGGRVVVPLNQREVGGNEVIHVRQPQIIMKSTVLPRLDFLLRNLLTLILGSVPGLSLAALITELLSNDGHPHVVRDEVIQDLRDEVGGPVRDQVAGSQDLLGRVVVEVASQADALLQRVGFCLAVGAKSTFRASPNS